MVRIGPKKAMTTRPSARIFIVQWGAKPMALIKCAECSWDISHQATVCPGCTKRSRPYSGAFVIAPRRGGWRGTGPTR